MAFKRIIRKNKSHIKRTRGGGRKAPPPFSLGGKMPKIVMTTSVSFIIPLIISFAGTYYALKENDALTEMRIKNIETTISGVCSDIKHLKESNEDIKASHREIKKDTEVSKDTFNRLNITLKSLSESLQSMAISMGRMDERLKTIEERRSR
jgi:uncharacterized protein YoxC